MTTESKILTVSYGTFSCTLEGFDDPFNTMKAIAEYFRDLAAEDRFFGAEPPQPDAAMLHRIAEREVSRLVNTQPSDGSVVRSPAKDAANSFNSGPATGRVTGRARPSRDLGAPVARPQPAPQVVQPMLDEAIPDGVAAKLARLRRSVNPEPAAEPAAETLTDDQPRAFTSEFGPDAQTAVESDLVSGFDGDGAEDLEDLAALDQPPAETATYLNGQDAISRLGALILDPEAANTAADDMTEAEAAALSEALSRDVPEAMPNDGPADVPAEMLADLALTADADALAESAPEDHPEGSGETVTADAGHAPSAPQMDAPSEAADMAAPAEATPDAAERAEAATLQPPANATEKSRRVSSRVVRIHPDDGPDEKGPARRRNPNATRILSSTGEDSEVARLLRQAEEVMAETDNLRRVESIAHLKAAVATTEAERAVSGDAAKVDPVPPTDLYRNDLAEVVQPDPEPAAPQSPDLRPRRKTVSVRPQEPRPGTIRPGMISPTPLVLVSEQRVDRLAPVEAPAPAVAAFLPEPEKSIEANPVQKGPMNPGIEGAPLVALRTGRLTGAIGMGAAAASPVAGRQNVALERIVQTQSADPDDDDDHDEQLSTEDEAGLASFAERVGVKSMADMLEAAAAYATCVEHRDRFTRPQLMRRLMASAGGKAVSREDGLRSFGTLLRTGRIEKVSRGHYVLAEHSPYLAEARRLN